MNEVHFRNLIRFYFLETEKSDQTAKTICTVYRDRALAESTVENVSLDPEAEFF